MGVLVTSAILEGTLREDLVWRPLAVAVQVPLLIMLLWRRTHPLLSVAVAFGGIGLLDLARIIAGGETAITGEVGSVRRVTVDQLPSRTSDAQRDLFDEHVG